MRIIYEDGNYRDERLNQSEKTDDFVDVSSTSEEFRKAAEEENTKDRPYRPAATLRPAEPEKTEPVVDASQAQMPQNFPQGRMYMPVQYAPMGYSNGQPVYYQYQGGYVMQYPQEYQMQTPQGQHPQQAVYTQQAQPTVKPAGGENNAGTRVLYQSPDFDKNEAPIQNKAIYGAPVQYAAPQPLLSSITHEDVVFASSPSVRTVASSPASGNFDVDDMEMSMFELNAMAHKYHAKTKNYRTSTSDLSLEVEDFEEKIAPDYYMDEEPEEEAPKKTVKKKKSKKGKKRKELVRKVVLCISILAIVVSCMYLYNEYRLSKMNAQAIEQANDLIINIDNLYINNEDLVGDSSSGDENEEPHELTEEEKQEIIRQKWEEVRAEYPDVNFPSNLQLEYAKLYGSNQDFAGYLKADGVGMQLPVVQTTNDEYYLRKDFYGRNTKYGCPFVTHLNTISEEKYGLDTNTVIFGHHMNDGSVFGVLDEYKSIDGFKAAPVISFNTKYHDYDWKVIAAFVTNAEESDDNGYVFKYYFTNLSSEERFSAYLNALSERSLYNTGVDVLPTDKILTLSTCSHEFENARFVVVARLVRNGESTEVDTSKATVNSNPRYPQAYYDKKKQDNPYRDAYRWEVG